VAELPTGSAVGIPDAGGTMLALQLRTGLAVGKSPTGAEGPFLYAEFKGCDYTSKEPSAATLLFTTHALSDVILHLMRGGVSVFGPGWAHLLSAAFTESMTEPLPSEHGGDVEPSTGQYL